MNQPKAGDQKKPKWSRTVLLATNGSHSIIAEVHSGKANPIAYSAYGEQSAEQEVATKLGFNGQLREANMGWYLLGNGYRAYNPRLMRFHSPDSWSPFGGGGLNAYMYCVGDPVNRSDPTGHLPILGLVDMAVSWVKKNVHLPGYRAKALGAPLSPEQTSEAVWRFHGARMSVANEGRHSPMLGLGAMLITVGTSNRMAGGSPAISDIGPTTIKPNVGWQASAFVGTVAIAGGSSMPKGSGGPPLTGVGSVGRSGGGTPRSSFDQPRTLYDGPQYVSRFENNQLQGSGPYTSSFTTTHQPRLTPNPQPVHWNSPSLHQPLSPPNSIYHPSPPGSPGSARSWSSGSSTRSRSSRSSYSSSSSSSSANSSIRSR